MRNTTRLDLLWAGTGDKIARSDTKIAEGWGAEKPSYQEMNQYLYDISVLAEEIGKYGVCVWRNYITYELGSVVFYNGREWKLNSTSSLGEEPGVSVYWIFNDGYVIGDMLMFSGTWIDNVTRYGWYEMIAENEVHGCTDLTDVYLRGSLPSESSVKTGSDSKTLVANNIPSHRHSVSQSVASGAHAHTYPNEYDRGPIGSWEVGSAGSTLSTYRQSAITGNHTHSYTLGNQASNPTAFTTQPAYRTVKIIRKCF